MSVGHRYGGPVVHDTTETSRNTTKLAQHNRNKPQHNEISSTQRKQATTQQNELNRNKPQHNEISTTQRKQATTQQN